MPVRPKPVATSSQIRSTSCVAAGGAEAREAVGIGELHARRALHERLDDRPRRARSACAATIAHRGVEAARGRRSAAPATPGSGAGRTGRCRSRRHRARARRWCRRGTRRRTRGTSCVRSTPRLAQYWNAIFSACSTADAPSDAKRKCGSSTGTTRASASGELDDDDVAVAEHGGVRAAVELCARPRRRARARGGRAC